MKMVAHLEFSESGRLLWVLLCDLRPMAVTVPAYVSLGDMCEAPMVNCFHHGHVKFVEGFIVLVFETGPHCVAQAEFEFLIFLLHFPSLMGSKANLS